MKISHIMIHLNFSQVVDSQIDNEILNNILDNDIILLSCKESDVDLLEPDDGLNLHKNMDTTKPCSILDELNASLPNHNIKHQYSTNTTIFATLSTISHPLSTMNISTTNPTPATNYNNTQHNTIPTHTPITIKAKKAPTTDTLKTLQRQPTGTILPTSITPALGTSYYTSPLPIIPNRPSTITFKSKNTPSNPQSEHLPFTLNFTAICPNYISKLNLLIYLAKICTDIQRNAELCIVKFAEKRLT